MQKYNYYAITLVLCLAMLLHSAAFAQKKRKKKRAVREFEIVYDKTATVAPGLNIPIGINATFNNGKKNSTQGYAGGKGLNALAWERFDVTVDGGVRSNDLVAISSDPRAIHNDKVVVTITALDDTTLKRSITLPVTYKYSFIADFSGMHGEHGEHGKNRLRVVGSDGRDGSDGTNGGDGGPGQTIEVYVRTTAHDSVNFLKVYVKSKSTAKEEFFLIDPRGGSLFVRADGGNGGNGGNGGDGAHGQNARDSTSKKGSREAGAGGNGGNGGNGGSGGFGGAITFIADSAAMPLMQLIKWSNNGGAAGTAGKAGDGGKGGSKSDTYPAGNDGVKGTEGTAGTGGMQGSAPTIIYRKLDFDW